MSKNTKETQILQDKIAELEHKVAQLTETGLIYQNIFEKLPIGIQVFDQKGILLQTNSKQEEILEVNYLKKGVGRINLLTNPFSFETNSQNIYQQLYKGLEKQRDIEYKPEAKKTKFLRETAVPVIQDGNVKYSITFLQDISEFKLSEVQKNEQNKEYLALFEEFKTQNEQLKLSKAKIEESEQFFRNLVENAPDAIYIQSDRLITYANKKAIELFGARNIEEIYNKNVLDFYHPDCYELVKQRLLTLNDLKQPVQLTIQKIKKLNGTYLDVETSGVPFMFNSKPSALIFIRDISKRVNAENIASQKSKELENFFECAIDLLCIANIDGYFIRLNKEWENVLGFGIKELTGRKFLEFVHPEDIDSTIDAVTQLSLKEKVINFTNRYRCKSGQYKWIEWKSISVDNTIYAAARDVTQQKQRSLEIISAKVRAEVNEQKYRRQYNFTQTLLNYLPISIFYKDKDGKYLGCNPAFEEFTGNLLDKIKGKTVIDLWNNDLSSIYHKSDLDLFESNEEFQSYEFLVKNAQNQLRDVVFHKAVFYDENNERAGIVGAYMDITERKQVEILLRQNADRLKILLDLNNLSSIDTDKIYNYALEKAIELCNSKIGLLGFLNQEETIVTIFAWSDSAMNLCKIKDKTIDFEVAKTGVWGEVIRQRKPIIINNFKRNNPLKKGTPEGHVEILNYMSIPIFDKDKIIAIIAVGNKEGEYHETDLHELTLLMEGVINVIKHRQYELDLIKAKKSAEKSKAQLYETEMRYRKMFENMKSGVAVCKAINNGTEFLVIDFNKAAEKITQVSKNDIIGHTIQEKSHYVIDSKMFNALKIINEHGFDIHLEPYYYEDTLRKGWRESFVYKLNSGEIVLIFDDVTDRKKSEIELQNHLEELLIAKSKIEESEEKLRFLFDNMIQGVVYHNQFGNIIFANEAASKILGLSIDQLLGKTSLDKRWQTIREDGSNYPGDQHPVVITLKTGLPVRNSIMGVFNPIINNYIWININSIPKFGVNEDKPYQVVVTFEDITEIRNAKEKAEESNRLKTSFLQNISHEVRTPLNAINGFAELLCNQDLSVDKKRMFSDIILKSSNKLINIIHDVIEISQIQSKQAKARITEFDFIDIIASVSDEFNKSAMEKKIQFIVNSPSQFKKYLVKSDFEKLKKILNHLIDNAIKFTAEGSVALDFELNENNVVITISDTGIGFPDEMKEMIFEPFRQIENSENRSFGGNGLGLSIVKAYIDMLNGSIQVQSKVNQGTVFIIDIPTNRTKKKESVVRSNKINKKVRTILIAEDEYSNYLYLETLLEETKLNLEYASNGKQAVEKCEQNLSIDLVFMDIKMPIMDGYTAAGLIKKSRPDIIIIAQTAYALDNEIEQFGSVFDDYITKPISKNLLLSKISKLTDIYSNT